MALPPEFDETEFLQDAVKLVVNREVIQWFRDVELDEVDPDLSDDRARLRWACTHKENDPLNVTILRLRLFDTVCGWANSNLGVFYGMPSTAFQEQFRFFPQVQLHFVEDWQDIEPGYQAVSGRISFRLMNETTESLTMSKANAIANRTQTAFNSGNGFVWRKGKYTAVYYDKERGYQLKINVRDKAEGKRVIEQVLDIQQHTPEWKFLKWSDPDEPTNAYPTVPPLKTVLGELTRMPRMKPIADVRFTYALLHIHGRTKSLVLCDRNNYFKEALAVV